MQQTPPSANLCLATATQAHDASVRMLRRMRVPLLKARGLHTSKEFDRAVAVLAAQLRKLTRPWNEAAAKKAAELLDVDWASVDEDERRHLVQAATQAAGHYAEKSIVALGGVFIAAVADILKAVRWDARHHRNLMVGVEPNAFDHRIARHMQRTEVCFVRDAQQRRAAAFSQQARSIVACGLEQGAGRQDISADLAAAADTALVQRSEFYWDFIASSFTGRARSYGQISSLAEAGVAHYTIHAVLDERTTNFCRYMDSKTFTIESAVRLFEQADALQDPVDIKHLQPWGCEGCRPDTDKAGLYVTIYGQRHWLADIERSGVGARDDRGIFVEGRSLIAGIQLPPFHGCCRTTIV